MRADGTAARRAAPSLGNLYLAFNADIFVWAVIPGGEADEIEELYERFTKMAAPWVSARGFAGLDWCRAELAHALGRGRADIARHRKAEINFMRHAGYRPLLALALNDYAELLLDLEDAEAVDNDAPGDSADERREHAIRLQDEALVIAQDLGMRPLTERVIARREFLRA